jgi:hypothetical protein
MTKTALSVYLFGLYAIFGIGLPFLLIPHFSLGMFGMSAGDDMWVRMLGLFVGIMGAYYVMAVKVGFEPFYDWTVPARYSTATFMTVMAILGAVAPTILIFASVDAIAATLTVLARRYDRAEAAERVGESG